MIIDTVCVICGKPLKRRHDHLKKYRPTCNHTCRGQLLAQINSGENNGMYKGLVDVECSNCGKPLKRYPCHADAFQHFFCTPKCQGEWRAKTGVTRGKNNARWKGGPVSVSCASCGKELARERDQVERNTNHFCDHVCYGAWLSENNTGENSPSWRGGWSAYYGPSWFGQREKARERDGEKCQVCGITKKKLGKAPDVHHIRPFREFGYVVGENENHIQANALSNLITLCFSCHRKAETGKIALQPPLF